MNTLHSLPLQSDTTRLADALAEHGYVIVPQFLPSQKALELYQYALDLPSADWQLAGIGRLQQQTINTSVRSDTIRWLSDSNPVEQAYLQSMDELRVALNRELFLGLFDYESHLAHYRPGAYYKKHLDAFKGRSNRVLTSVLYLNPEWTTADGGELVIYGARGEVLEQVLPSLGTLVLFLSDRFVHEVKVGQRARYSITGWYRLNSSVSGIIDPPR
ncbi:2OG-Fe(II) oxygenase [Aliidiomarina sp. Khilg15.8]